ncbi:MAG: Gfo/Idh/MocA family oxidoreductase, partial [Planctomycetota bacterium]|nr:Gfo/Idh/MocA family oxidoreductase [Planctomycetota bacterium]
MTCRRREFLSKSCRAAAGAALALSPFVHGKARAAPSETVVLGVIGIGGRGHGLMTWALGHRAVRVASVSDVNRRHLERAAKTVREAQGKDPRRVPDFRRLLDDTSLDAVIVATPHHWHGPIAVRALDAGKHVYVEKPASHVLREGRRLVEASRRSKRLVQHGTQMRSSEVTTAAGEVLRSGVLGTIKMSKAWGVEPRRHAPPVADSKAPDWLDYDRWLGPAPERPFNRNRFQRWNNYRDYGNGEIGGDGIHD